MMPIIFPLLGDDGIWTAVLKEKRPVATGSGITLEN